MRGGWRDEKRSVDLPLDKYVSPRSGERRVRVERGQGSPRTRFSGSSSVARDFSLLEAELQTGRTHQIRVHLAHLGFPIAGDDKYGDFELNKALAQRRA